MTAAVYTGLIDEETDADEDSCYCEPSEMADWWVCSMGGEPMHWTPDLPVLRFDRPFTPPYVPGGEG